MRAKFVNEAFWNRKPEKPATPPPPVEKPKEKSYFEVFLSNLSTDEYGLPIMFWLSNNGFVPNNKYGNPKTNYYAFDVRGNHEIYKLIEKQESFLVTMEREGTEYMVVGLRLDERNADVKELSRSWPTSGRYGYVFAGMGTSKEIIDFITKKTGESDVKKVLVNEAAKSAKNFYTTIKNWEGALKKITFTGRV